MGDPQRSAAVENDRRSSPRFPAELLGKASVRLLGGSEVTLVNFSERGILFQSDQRLLVGARGTVRIVVGSETTIAAGTVVRSLVQGMASGKLAFHTALHLDQPLALAAAVAARERARLQALVPEPDVADPGPDPAPEPIVVEHPAPMVAAPVPAGKTIEKRSRRPRAEQPAALAEPPAPVPVVEPAAEPGEVEPAAFEPAASEGVAFEATEPAPDASPAAIDRAAPAALAAPPPLAPAGFDAGGFDGGSFGWADPAPAAAGLSVLFVSTTRDRTARLQALLAAHRRDVVLTPVMHTKAEAIADLARQHDVLLFDVSIGADALAGTMATLRQSPLGASIAIYAPPQAELPAAVTSLANACVAEAGSGDTLVAALRDAAWTPWQPIDPAQDTLAAPLPDLSADLAALTAARDELQQAVEGARAELTHLRGELDDTRVQLAESRRERDELRGQLEAAARELERTREQERTGAAKIAELERVVADAARAEVAAARAQSQLAATTEELALLRNELDAARFRATSDGADAQRTAAKYAAIETSARQAIDELKSARADAQRLTRERDQALAAVEAERARADAALAAARDDAKKSRRIVGDDAVSLATAKLQRQIDELRAQLSQEQDARRELEELLDENAANLEKTIQAYEERLEALGAGVEDARATKPKKTRQG